MFTFHTTIFYIVMFFSVFVQVYFLITFFEHRKRILNVSKIKELADYPGVTVIVPSYNEEKSIVKTLDSLLALDYPKDKLKIIAVDDGSHDSTWEKMQSFKNNPQVRIFTKENGGKWTALNLALEHVDTPFFSCLDADSTVEPDAMKKIMPYFEDMSTMAVIPAAVVTRPESIVQHAQRAEYNMAVFFKKVFSLIGGLHVTPGTLPVYRKSVYEKIGGFRYGHNGEDMEMAFRMHKNHLKIVQCHEAKVYTIPPKTIKVLYRQRVRWISAYLGNLMEYREMLFKKKYGNFGWFTLPSSFISIAAVLVVFAIGFVNILKFIINKIIQFQTVGWGKISLKDSFLNWNINSIMLIIALSYVLVVASLFIGNLLSEGKAKFSANIFYYVFLYSIIAPLWLIKAVYNTIFSRKTSWR